MDAIRDFAAAAGVVLAAAAFASPYVIVAIGFAQAL